MKYLLLILLVALNAAASDAFITPNQLKELQNSGKLVLLDVSSRLTYNQSHIAGAVHINIPRFIESAYSELIVSFSDIVQGEIAKLGIDDNSSVVIYSRNTPKDQLNSSYLALVLISHGFENVSILDGGYMAWVFEYNSLVSAENSPLLKNGKFKVNKNQNILINSDYLKRNMLNTHIVDSREISKYSGESESEGTNLLGHITNAKSHYYRDNFFDDLTVKSEITIQKDFIERLNLKKNEEVIVYGDTIFDASMNWYILYKKFAFSNAKIYKESFSKWAEEKLPVTLNKDEASLK